MLQNKVKILQLITSLNIGGTEHYLLSLVQRLNKRKYEVRVGYLKERGPLAEAIEREGISLYPLSCPWRLFLFLRKERIQLLHTYLYRANIMGRIIGRIAGVPVIISSQRSTDDWRRWHHSVADRWTARFANKIIANSEVVRKRLIHREGISEEKITVIYSGIDLNKFRVNIRVKREALGIKPRSTVMGTVARLHPAKGLTYLLKTLKQVKDTIPEATLLIMGDGPIKKKLEEETVSLGLKERVIFTGFRQDIPQLLSLLDVFVLPSLWEGLPSSLLEALAMGKPVVATDVGGVREIIQDRVHGLLVPPRDPGALAQAILWMLKNKKEAQEMAKRGKERVEKYFTVDRMIEETEKLYDELIQEKIGS
ncbi:D-inositol-3-phosphate glycosyltransferase [subsurface metagenome]